MKGGGSEGRQDSWFGGRGQYRGTGRCSQEQPGGASAGTSMVEGTDWVSW